MKSFKITQSITDRQDASLGIFFKEVSKLPMIDINKEIELSRRIKDGDESAVNELVKANLRFLISVAKQYQNNGIPLVDLIQEGSTGLIQAARLYDESKGFKFISYAVWWIRQAITRAISEQCRTIKVPMNQIVYMNKINKSVEKFEQENGRKPSTEELELETGLSFDKISLNMNSVNKTLSLDTPFKDDENSLLDITTNTNSPNTDKIVSDEYTLKEIEKILSNLSYRERDVIRMLFGLGMNPMTIEEVASRFGVVEERIRQIQKEAIEKIRINYSDDLKELL